MKLRITQTIKGGASLGGKTAVNKATSKPMNVKNSVTEQTTVRQVIQLKRGATELHTPMAPPLDAMHQARSGLLVAAYTVRKYLASPLSSR